VTRLSRVSKNPVVPAKVKLAFEIISNDAKATLESAAAGAGLSTYRLRRLLKLPQVRAWIAEERRAQLDAICASNPESLKRIRDTSANDMAAVGAIKTLEDAGRCRRGDGRQAGGITAWTADRHPHDRRRVACGLWAA
jgi:hypothetical protein